MNEHRTFNGSTSNHPVDPILDAFARWLGGHGGGEGGGAVSERAFVAALEDFMDDSEPQPSPAEVHAFLARLKAERQSARSQIRALRHRVAREGLVVLASAYRAFSDLVAVPGRVLTETFQDADDECGGDLQPATAGSKMPAPPQVQVLDGLAPLHSPRLVGQVSRDLTGRWRADLTIHCDAHLDEIYEAGLAVVQHGQGILYLSFEQKGAQTLRIEAQMQGASVDPVAMTPWLADQLRVTLIPGLVGDLDLPAEEAAL